MALDRTDPRGGRPTVVVPEAPLPPLPRSLWESREVRDAVRDRSPGAVVALARRAHGLRQDELGALAGFSQSAISRLESGSNIAYDLRVLRPLQRLLGIPAHLLGLADHSLPVAADELDRLGFAGAADGGGGVVGLDLGSLLAITGAAVFSGPGGTVSAEALNRLRVLRRVINDAHNWRGSDALMSAARGLYDFVDRLRRSARGEQRRDLLGIAATYAEFLGWLHEETGDPRGAIQWTARALEQGQAADSGDLVAYSYVRMSQLAEADGDADRVAGLARAARREKDLSPMVRALALRQEARGLAGAGDEAACMDRLDEARAEFERVTPPSDDEYWIGYCSAAEHFELERAASWLALGRPNRAIEVYEDVRQQVWRRLCAWEQGVHVAKLAHAHAIAGETDHAVSLAYDALDTARATKSAQVLRELGRLGSWEGSRDVAELARGAR
ncbi:helix-turn-helix domain-containing protein [Saccharothrix hoggarensis]|uniref:Helix-turn-helix domain-containing protein n=1 Tax=Saccharothrix hoggarensis TaxID=913853 RepID=A0ABW3QR99_9PSEU